MEKVKMNETIHEFQHNGETMAVVIRELNGKFDTMLRNVDQLVKGHTVNMMCQLPQEIYDSCDYTTEEFKEKSIEFMKTQDWFEKFVTDSGNNCRELYAELVASGEIVE